MAQAGFTPIQLYYSSTASNVPTAGSLTSGELAINIADGKLFYKDSGGTVRTIASGATSATTGTNAQLLANNGTGGFSNVTVGAGLSYSGGVLSTSGGGTVTSVAMTVPSFLSVSGSPITSSGTLAVTLSGTALPVANGGTGQTSYTNGQLLIGNSTGNTLTKTTLTAGTGISITNGSGSITIATTTSGDNSLLWYFMG